MSRFKMCRSEFIICALFLTITCLDCWVHCSDNYASSYNAKTRYINSELSRFLSARTTENPYHRHRSSFHSNHHRSYNPPVTHAHYHHGHRLGYNQRHNSDHHTTEPYRHHSSENLHRLRHRRFPKLDGFLAKIEREETTTLGPPVRNAWDTNYHRYETTTVQYDNVIERNKFLKNGKSLKNVDFLYSFEDKRSETDHFDDFYEKVKSETTTTNKYDGGAGLDEYEDSDEQENPDNVKDYDDQPDIWSEDDNDMNEDDGEEDAETDTDDNSEFQAEEPTQRTTTLGSFTDYKWQHYGTREKVTEMRNRKMQPDERQREINETLAHIKRIMSENACHKPSPRVMKVQRDPSKLYTPHCTVLHRCGEDTGCCGHSRVCTAKYTQRVELYFYASTLGHSPQVEKLTFDNHTECKCVDRSALEKNDRLNEYEISTLKSIDNNYEDTRNSGSLSSHNRRDIPEARHPFRPGPTSLSSSHPSHRQTIHTPGPPEQIKRCRCPSLFQPRVQMGICTCECDINNTGCDSMSRGREYFSFKDRLCIQNGQCRQPKCEFGLYVNTKGRCPKKIEKFEAISRLHHSRHYN